MLYELTSQMAIQINFIIIDMQIAHLTLLSYGNIRESDS